MDPTGTDLANPWLPYVVLGTAVLVTISTMAVQIRALGAGVRAWLRSEQKPAQPSVLLAGSAGLGSIVGAAAAVTMGGPGALVWMWIATILGMALHHAEGSGAAGSEGSAPYVARHLGGLGKPLAALFCLAFLAFAGLAGGMLQTQQAAVTLHAPVGASVPLAAAVLGALALPFSFSAKLRDPLVRFGVPLALIVYAGVALGVAVEDPLLLQFAMGDAWNQAFAITPIAGGTAGGAIGVVVYHGVMRAVLAGEIGVGSATLGTEPGGQPARAGAGAMLVPLVTISTVSTLTALAVLAAPVSDESVVDGPLVPLERHLSRGLRPSKQVGQTIVLPDDSGVEGGHYYAMMLRSNPRGHQFARLLRDENVILFPEWKIAEETTQVLFRSRDPGLRDLPSWDVRIDCVAEKIDGRGGPDFIRLKPQDPNLEFTKLIALYELDPKPHIPLADFEFVGRVARANSPDESLGEHLAMYEAPSEDRPFNPKFHEFFRGGFRGPYAQDPSPRPPWGFVAREGFDEEVGSVVRLEFRADPRGDDLVRVNRAGGVEAPPWDLMMNVRELVVRNDGNPSSDIIVAVQPRLDGFRIRFDTDDPEWTDFRKIEKMEGYSGPFVRIGDFEFEAEVHTDTRLADDLEGRRSLVPIHEQTEPVGSRGALPYHPHPGELAAANIAGPFESREGVELVASRIEHRFGGGGATLFALVAVIFGISTIAIWSGYAARAATFLLGDWAAGPTRVALVAAAMTGGLLRFDALLAWVDTTMAVVLVPNLLALALIRPRAKRSDTPPPEKSETEPERSPEGQEPAADSNA